jgi:hypothetical protein
MQTEYYKSIVPPHTTSLDLLYYSLSITILCDAWHVLRTTGCMEPVCRNIGHKKQAIAGTGYVFVFPVACLFIGMLWRRGASEGA